MCGKHTGAASIEAVEEGVARRTNNKPMVCNKCLVDLRGDMATELEVRRQLGTLEAKIEGYAWKQWILYFAFSLALAALTFVAGLWLGG